MVAFEVPRADTQAPARTTPVSATAGASPDLYNAWSQIAPGLPPSFTMQLASSGVSPSDPVGAWIVRTGLPALGSQRPASANMSEGMAAARAFTPSFLAQVKKLPIEKQADVFRQSAVQVGQLSDQDLQRLATTGSTDVHHSFFNRLGDIATTGVRDIFTGLSAGYEGGQALYRAMQGQSHELPGPDPLGMNDKIQVNPPRDVGDITSQITAVQALGGKGLGSGFFPGGPAHEAAVEAQKRAASIQGHALTPGRALAVTVLQPGSRPYSIISGMTDAAIALHGDPAALALGEISDVRALNRVFSPTSDAARETIATMLHTSANDSTAMRALSDWAGSGGTGTTIVDAITDKLKADPGSLTQLVQHPDFNLTFHDIASALGREHVGGFYGWRHGVNTQEVLSWLNSEHGARYAQDLADKGFTQIWLDSGRKMPVDVAADLAEARDPNTVRQILGRNLGTVIRDVPDTQYPYSWTRSIHEMRLFQYLPKGYVDFEHMDNSVEQTYRMLKAAKVDPAHYDELLGDVARSAGDRVGFYDAYTRSIQAVKDTLVANGVDKDLAHKLTRFQTDSHIENAARWAENTGSVPHINNFMADGDNVPILGPHMSSELLNRALPTLDMRDIHRLVGAWGPAWNHPVIGPMMKNASYVADSLTNVFKIFTLLKLALPVRFLADEQARMASAGLDSFWNHPISYISHVIAGGSEADITGANWAEQLGDRQSQYRRAIGEVSGETKSIWSPEQRLLKNYVNYARGEDGYMRAWADEVSHLHLMPESREVARGLADVAYAPAGIEGHGGLDAVKEWFFNGAGQKYRDELARANLWDGQSREMMFNRGAADAYIDSVVDRIHQATGGDQDLIERIAHGEGFTPHGVTKEFRQTLEGIATHELDVAPDIVRGKAFETVAQRQVLRNMTDRLFSALMDAPTSKLTRSPAFRQFYLQRLDEIHPYIVDGTIDAVKADIIAKDFALRNTHDLLYYPGERATVTDKLRNIAPFGEAWRNVLKTWTGLAIEHPQIVRHAQQGVTAARESGFFYIDPQTLEEVFNLVPGNLMQHLAGVPFPLTAPVSGLNILGTGLPGVGPAVQIPASLLPTGNKITDTLRQHLMPYGAPSFESGFFEGLFPGWSDKFRISGMLAHYLPGHPDLPFLTPSQNDTRLLQNVAHSVLKYHLSSGSYDVHDPEVMHKLVQQSLWEARKLYLLRGLAQFAAPAAPAVQSKVELKDGSLVQSWLLAKDWRTMEKTYPNFSDATAAFVNKYGPKLIYATEADARPLVYGTPTTEEAAIWKHQHADFAAEFPNAYGYWAPADGQFSYQAYLESIKNGEMDVPSMDDWTRLAQARLGNAVYDRFRALVGVSPNKEQRAWLAVKKQEVTKEFPGFNDDSLTLARKTPDQMMAEVRQAAQSPSVAKTPIAQAATAYLTLRDEALAEAQRRTGSASTTLKGQTMNDLRDWLYEKGSQIALRVPDFATMWQNLFLNEVEPNG